MKQFLEWIIFISAGGFIIGLIGLIIGYVTEKIIYSKRDNSYRMNCTKTVFVKTVIQWALNHIEPLHHKESIQYKLRYYKHKTKLGVFFSRNREIIIYINNHQTIIEIIDSVLHEVVHYKQFRSDPKCFQRQYEKLLSENGYENHPMEKEARKIASKLVGPCLEFLITQNKLIKAS